MKITCFIAALLMSICLFAETGIVKNAETSSELVRVKGKGTGETKELALKDAYRDAVETAVGMFVDAEQLVDNDQLVEDRVLTHSNGYIERYEEKKVAYHKDKGLFELVILAWVRRCELTRKLTAVMPAMTLNVSGVNQNLYAEIVTRDRRDKDAESLLKSAFDEFDPLSQLMKITVINKKPEVSAPKGSSDMKVLSYQLKFEIDPDKYFKVWMPRMDKLFSRISLSQGKPFDFKRHKAFAGLWKVTVPEESCYRYAEMLRTDYYAYDQLHFMCAQAFGVDRLIIGRECHCRSGSRAENCLSCMYDIWEKTPSFGEKDCRCVRRWKGIPEMKAKSKLYVALVKQVNKRGSSGTIYELSDSSASVISSWMSRYAGLTDERCFDDRSARSTVYHVALKDEFGAEIELGDCRAFNHDMSNIGCVCWGNDESSDERNKPGNTIPYVVYMTPWVGCFAGECSTWVDIEVNVGDIAKISTISIKPEAASAVSDR